MLRQNGVLKSFSKNLHRIMHKREAGIPPKELAVKSKISYSTLAPILRGDRDFGVTKLITLAEALNVTPNDLLAGAFKKPINQEVPATPKYLALFITNAQFTRCKIIELESQSECSHVLKFCLSCEFTAAATINQLKISIHEITQKNIDPKEICIYASVIGYEHTHWREQLTELGDRDFGVFCIEPDWISIYHSIFTKKNGILITINNGYVISYSLNLGETIQKIQGYYFPVSDEAGNFWLGCEAIKHAINVYEGSEERTSLSDKILSLTDSDLNTLATQTFEKPTEAFLEAAAIVKELAYTREKKAGALIQKSLENILRKIELIDSKSTNKLPISFAGDLAYLYEELLPAERLYKTTFVNEVECFNYAQNVLLTLLKQRN